MSILTNSLLTWVDFSAICLSAIKAACCNVDALASDIPSKLCSGQGVTSVRTITTVISPGPQGTPQTYNWYANPSNLISVVSSTTIESEWNTFLTAAGIDIRSNKVIQAKEMGLAVGLYMQFMSFHMKPIYSRRQIYNTVETQNLYQGCKYVTGSVTPTYTLTPAGPGVPPTIEDSDITNVVAKNFQANQLMTHYDNPVLHRCYLS